MQAPVAESQRSIVQDNPSLHGLGEQNPPVSAEQTEHRSSQR
jgi:hypothetical protein